MRRALWLSVAITAGLIGSGTPALAAQNVPAGIAGTWQAEQTSPLAAPTIKSTLTFRRMARGISGQMHMDDGDIPLFDVQEAGNRISFTVVLPGTPYVTVHYTGTRTGNELRLVSAEEGNGVYTLTARRGSQAAAAQAQTTPPALRGSSVPAAQSAPDDAKPSEEEPLFASANPPVPEPEPPVASAARPAPPSTALPTLRDLAPNGLAKTPLMGWASRQKVGLMVDDEAIRQVADGLEETGLAKTGYTMIEVDDGWQGGRDADGAITGSDKFPDMKALGNYIHDKGLKFGLATAAGPKSCGGLEGSLGHEEADAARFAEWGVDYLVLDWCGAGVVPQHEMQARSQKMAEALRATGRGIVFGLSQDGLFDVASWAAKAGANVWRTGMDIEDSWQSMIERGFAQNGKEAFAGPGRWNDVGLVQAGNGGMSPDEYRMHLNLWTILAAPLMLGSEVRIMMRDTQALLTNAELIAIHQDSLGRQGKRVAQSGDTEVWAKPLADGGVALALFNRGNTSAAAGVTWEQLGIEGTRTARDLWWHQDTGKVNGRYVAFLTAHTSMLVKLSR